MEQLLNSLEPQHQQAQVQLNEQQFNENERAYKVHLWERYYWLKLLLDTMCLVQLVTGGLYLFLAFVLSHNTSILEHNTVHHILITSTIDITLSIVGLAALHFAVLRLFYLLSLLTCIDTALNVYGVYFKPSHVISIIWSFSFMCVCWGFTYVMGKHEFMGTIISAVQDWWHSLVAWWDNQRYRDIEEPPIQFSPDELEEPEDVLIDLPH